MAGYLGLDRLVLRDATPPRPPPSSPSGLGCLVDAASWRGGNAECHANVESLLQRFVRSGAVPDFLAFRDVLLAHAAEEERTSFPIFASLGGDLTPFAAEHRALRDLLERIAAGEPGSVGRIRALLAQHDQREGAVLYPALDARVPRRPSPPGLRGLGRPAALGEDPPAVRVEGIPQLVSGPRPDPATFRRVHIPDGKRGTTATLRVMGELATEGAQDPYFIAYARGIVRECPGKDWRCELGAILAFDKRWVTYRGDSAVCEWVSSPGYVLFVDGAEDCDGLATLIASQVMSIGYGAKVRAVALNPRNPSEYSHVYAMAEVPGVGWVAMDPVPTVARLGWEPPKEQWVMEPNDLVVVGSGGDGMSGRGLFG